MADPLDRARSLNNQRQYRIFRAAGGLSVWMNEYDALQTVKRQPAEWSLDPWNGQTYGAAQDPWAVEVARGSVTPIERRPSLSGGY